MVKSRKLPHSEPKTESHARYLRKCGVHTGTVSQVKSGHFINNLHATDLYSTGSCASFRDGVNVNVNVNNLMKPISNVLSRLAVEVRVDGEED
jgi:hypothetical protein